MNDFKQQWVVLVDDDEDDRFFIQQAFKKHGSGYLLQMLPDGYELFQLLAESVQLPSLLILDLNMPLMNGFEVLTRLRADETYACMPIVILTTSDAETDRLQAWELGANGFVTKPPTLAQLTKIIDQLKQDWLAVSI